MKAETSDSEILEKITDRKSLLSANSKLITQLQKKINGARFRVQEGDSVKLGYIRAMIQALQVQNSILKDAEIDALKREVEEIRELIGRRDEPAQLENGN